MIFIFYFFAGLLVVLSIKSLLGGAEFLRFFRTEIAKPRSSFAPFVTIIAPCRGLDADLEENLNALFAQDYPEYEIVFVVDDKNDPALNVIRDLLDPRSAESQKVRTGSGSDRVRSSIVIAGKTKTSSQKVENLREAVLHAAPKSEAFVFVDSDARPSKDWLRALVAPLADKNVGAATGYRWFISINPSFASELRSSWNASIASALGPNTKTNFCWGGSTAIRRDTFERLHIRERWEGTLADDFAVTRVINDAGLSIVFVPQALTASLDDCTFAQLLEFTTRQMKITRVYVPKLWIMSIIGSALFNSVMIAAALIVAFGRQNVVAFYTALATILSVAICSTGKSWLRLKAANLALPQHRSGLQKQFWTQNTLWILTPAIFLFNSIAAAVSRRITWRGTVYELKSPTETVIIAD